MAKETLAVYCPCQFYLERLLGHLDTEKNRLYEIKAFTEEPILKDYLAENKVKAVLLSRPGKKYLEKEKIQELISEILKKNISVMMLGETEDDFLLTCQVFGKETAEMFTYIDIYQAIGVIRSEIERVIAADTVYEEKNSKPDCIIAGLYSPADKVSHPEIAARIAERYRNETDTENAKVLYINLEPFSGMSAMMNHRSEINLSDVIYAYRTNPGKLPEILERACGRYCGMSVLLSAEDCDDLKELGEGGWPDFLAAVAAAGGYLILLIDVFNYSIDMMMMVLTQCGKFYIPALPFHEDEGQVSLLNDKSRMLAEEQKRAKIKMQEFRQFIINLGDGSMADKIIELEV